MDADKERIAEVLIRYATGKLIRGQMIGAAIGAVAGVVCGFLAGRKRAAVQETAQQPMPTEKDRG